MEMQILKFNFFFYTISGLWRPLHWTSKSSKLLYNVFTIVMLYLFAVFALTHIMYIIFVVESIEKLISCAFYLLAIISLWTKMITIMIRHDQIIELIEIIQREPCKPCDEEELNIQITYDREIRSYSMPYVILCVMSAINSILGGILYMLNGILPYGFAWVPWDYSSNLVFVITSIQEILCVVISIIPNLATETTVLGFCLHVCARFDILKHRIEKMIQQRKEEGNTWNKTSRLSEHVSHHLLIIRLAEMINDVFSYVMFAQFSTSIIILCTLGYHLTFHLTLVDIITLSAYAFCTFLQIFYYCWGGNEITLKSAAFGTEIYNMDWTFMTSREQKDLLIIMKRSSRPIKLTSSFLVTLSLESYSNLLKASFSVFNLLQQF